MEDVRKEQSQVAEEQYVLEQQGQFYEVRCETSGWAS